MSEAADLIAIAGVIEGYGDAIGRRDFAALADLFVADASWKVGPPFDLHFTGAAIVPTIAAILETYSFFLQMTQGRVISLAGDKAQARTIIREIGQSADGASGLDNLGRYHDEMIRTPQGWKFASRRFEPLYVDTAPLRGNPVVTPAVDA